MPLCRAGFHLEGSLPEHRVPGCEPWGGLDSSVPGREEGSQRGVMGVSRLSEVRLDLCQVPMPSSAQGRLSRSVNISEGMEWTDEEAGRGAGP